MKKLLLLLAVVGMLFTASATAQTNNKLIKFQDKKTKKICTKRWDTNSDRELSYEEAAAVKDLGNAFKGKKISTFNELKYFTGLTSIAKEFNACISLTSITIPDSVTSIGSQAFSGCNSLESVTIPGSVTSIGIYAFYDCSSLKEVYYTGDLSAWCKINFEKFGNPLYLSPKFYINGVKPTNITIPSNITEIKPLTFFGYKRLERVTIPDSVTEIGDWAFYGCSSLTSVTIPNSVTRIGERAFADCYSLTSVTIPNSVTRIGENAFEGCNSLTSVYCKPTTPPTPLRGWDIMFGISVRKIYVPRNSVKAYKSAEGWKDYADKIVGHDLW